MALLERSESAFNNYARHLAKIALHFNAVPLTLTSRQIDDYLYYTQHQGSEVSLSYFKFAVYGLRFAFRMEGLREKYIALPSIKRDKKLPVVLSREEIKRLLLAPRLLKHKILIGLLYGCGLRCFEARNIQIADLDFDRKMLHVRQGKGKKDRYVPLSPILIEWIKKYIYREKPKLWLFYGRPGRGIGTRFTNSGVRFAIEQAGKKAKIIKNMSVHTLRHTFATHLLEDGLDIVSIKELLGHSKLETTLIYLHVAQYDRIKSFSPLDTLYVERNSSFPVFQNNTPSGCTLLNHIRECQTCKTDLHAIMQDAP